MLNYSSLVPLKIYRKQKLNFIEGKDKVSGTAIFLAGTKEENQKIMKSSCFHLLTIKSYYIPKRIIMKDDRNTTKRVFNNQKDSYDSLRDTNKRVNNFKMKVSDYKRKNLMIDLSPYTENLFTEKSKWNNKMKLQKIADTYFTLFNSSEYDNYEDKFLIIPISKEIQEPNKYFNLTENNSLIQSLYNMIMFNMGTDYVKNIKLIIVNVDAQMFFRVDLSSITKKDLPKLARYIKLLAKYNSAEGLSEEDEKEIDSGFISLDTKKRKVPQKLTEKITNQIFPVKPKYLTGAESELLEKIEDKIEESSERFTDDFELLDQLSQDEVLKDYVSDLAKEKITAKKNNQRNARVEQYQKQAKQVKINNKTLDDIINENREKEIDTVPFKVKTVNNKITKSVLKDFEKNYNQKLSQKDQMMIIHQLSDESKTIRVFLKDYNEVESSDTFTKKVTKEFLFVDENNKKHTIKLDFPKMIDDRYIYVNGSKKMILKQLVLLPVVKLKPDTVQVTGNYRKMFISRYGIKVNPKIERLKKVLPTIASSKIKVNPGDCLNVNTAYLTTLDYDELASQFISLEIHNNKNIILYFNQERARDELSWDGRDNTIIPIGKMGNQILELNTKTNDVMIDGGRNLNRDLLDFIIDALIECDPAIESKLTDVSVGKRFMYSRCSILSRDVPLGILLAYHEGLSTLLTKAKIKTEFSDKRKVLSPEQKNKYSMIPFKNGYLYYEMFPISNSLLLSCFNEMDTKSYEYEKFDDKEVYLEYFFNVYGSMNVSKGFDNIIESMIDPITKEVLEDYDLPTEFTELMLYANMLLSDNSYSRENNMDIYRCRSNEVINAYFNELLIEAYNIYKNTGKAMSVPQDALIKRLVASPLVEEYSILNPVLEAEKLSTTTYKGIGGLNLDRAFSNEKRSYDPTMLGNLGLATPDSGKTGAVRTLTFDPNIISTRGYMKAGNNKDTSELEFTNMLTPSEIVSPFVASKDDAPRIGMSTTQNKHVIPVEKTDKLLVGTGAEKALPYLISNDFAFKAKQDGKVVDIKDNMMIVEYKDKSRDFVDLDAKIAKNGGGGFYHSNKLSTNLKVGSTFKEGDVLACNEQYIKGKGSEAEYAVGTLTKVALTSGAWTFEDSTTITENLSKDMTAYVTMKKEIFLGPNSNVDYIVKKGQEVKTGDTLLKFENSFDEKEINLLLSKLGDEYKSEIEDMSKNTLHSKYTGVIEDVQIYWNVEEDEMSDSLKKLISSYKKNLKSKEKYLKENGINTDDLILPSSDKLENNGKIKGKNVGDGVLIEIYVKYKDIMGVGDKITYYTALKGVIGSVIPADEAPFSEYRQEEPIDAILTPFSVISRMTNSIFYMMWSNKVLIELKRQIGEIYGEK